MLSGGEVEETDCGIPGAQGTMGRRGAPPLMAALSVRDVATGLLQELLRLDTVNPPGNETRAAQLLRDYLEGWGISCALLARVPERANLVARIPGRGPAAPRPLPPSPTAPVPAAPPPP